MAGSFVFSKPKSVFRSFVQVSLKLIRVRSEIMMGLMLAGAAGRHDEGHRADLEIQMLPLDYPHSLECFCGAIDSRLRRTYLVSVTLGGGDWRSHSWCTRDIHGCTHYHHDHHDGGSCPLLLDDKVWTFIIAMLNLVAVLMFCCNVPSPPSGLRWLRGECGQLVVKYAMV